MEIKKAPYDRASDLPVGTIVISKGDGVHYKVSVNNSVNFVLNEVDGKDHLVFSFGDKVDSNALKAIYGLLLE